MTYETGTTGTGKGSTQRASVDNKRNQLRCAMDT